MQSVRHKNSKRKRVVLTLEEKLEVIEHRESGHSIDKIAEKYNIGTSTVSEIYKKRVEIENAVEKNKLIGAGTGQKTIKEGKKAILEEELFSWYLEQKEQGILPTSNELKEQAKVINQKNVGFEDWNPTKGWLTGFKERYGIRNEQYQASHDVKDEIQQEKNPWQVALESATSLLEFIDSHSFPLKDVITVRMIRDKIAEDLNGNPEYNVQ